MQFQMSQHEANATLLAYRFPVSTKNGAVTIEHVGVNSRNTGGSPTNFVFGISFIDPDGNSTTVKANVAQDADTNLLHHPTDATKAAGEHIIPQFDEGLSVVVITGAFVGGSSPDSDFDIVVALRQ